MRVGAGPLPPPSCSLAPCNLFFLILFFNFICIADTITEVPICSPLPTSLQSPLFLQHATLNPTRGLGLLPEGGFELGSV